MGRHSHPPIMAVKLIALVVLVFSGKSDANEETVNSLDRQSFSLSTNCNDSEPLFIKNLKKRQPYLTADLETNAVKAGTKTGDANQQWMWSVCDYAIHLKNVATGGCLTSEGVLDEFGTISGGRTCMMVLCGCMALSRRMTDLEFILRAFLDLLASTKGRLHWGLLKRSSTK